MAKNTASSKFRAVNVDQFDEDNYEDEEVAPEVAAAEIASREAECRKLLNAGNKLEALRVSLRNPPLLSKDPKEKEKNFANVLSVLTAFKSDEINTNVPQLEQEELDILMKYIYRGMQNAEESASAILLVWHAAVVATGGLGTIIRVLTGRKTV